jgi:hypothetical protein
VTFGDLDLIPLSDGVFRLDGGAMFGVVPKPLWEKRAPADDRNRIRLGLRPLLVRGERTVLIDAGIGGKMDEKSVFIYGIDRTRSLAHSMADAGVAGGDVDIVLATHLHFDHAGGFTVRQPDGAVVPAFSKARYAVRAGEWDDATHPHERNRASYLPENFLPLAAGGVLDLFAGDRTIAPGVRVVRTGGAHEAPSDRAHRIGRTDGGVRRGSAAHGRARRRCMDHGVRPLPDGYARLQARLRPRGDRARVFDILRARSGHRCRVHPRGGWPPDGRRGDRRRVIRDAFSGDRQSRVSITAPHTI